MDAITDISRIRIAKLYYGIQPLAYQVLQDMTRLTQRVCNISQGIRSFEDQMDLYSQGRKLTPKGWIITNSKQIVTNAQPGLSWHCYGLAFDISFVGKDPYLLKEPEGVRQQVWETYGNIGKAHSLRWGGDFRLINGVKDLPHLEMTYGLTLDQALELYSSGGNVQLWAYLDKLRNETGNH